MQLFPRFILLLVVQGGALDLYSQGADTTMRRHGRAKFGIFFKRYFDFKNNGSQRKYEKDQEKSTPRLAFPFESEAYSLVFEDNFDSFDRNTWQVGQPWGRFHVQFPHQYYGDSEIFVKDGTLHLLTRYAPKPILSQDSVYISTYATGLVNSYYSHNFIHGYFAIRSKNPKGPATWPAFWLTGKYNWPPEIDIFEMYGKCDGNDIHEQTMTLHFGKTENNSKTSITKSLQLPANTDTVFHIYSCLWEPGKISFITDGVLVKSVTLNGWMEQFYREKMFIVLNNALDHRYLDCIDNAKLPNDFQIDWIRVYQRKN